ncbi:putative high affinity copper protein [Xylariaceae sp. FL1272]|nr:putative high affinity copper protein [Xylariaceae sp. FL1272]
MEGMGDMEGTSGMDMGDVGSCKISVGSSSASVHSPPDCTNHRQMLWNWNTIDACFLSEEWQIKSQGGFAGLCIGVILLVMFLEGLRRLSKMYDRHLIRQHQKTATGLAAPQATGSADGSLIAKDQVPLLVTAPFRPSISQQAVRALLHTLQFATAYWIMLLAMYYNGFVIISIFIGAYIGSFIFQWEQIGPRSDCAVESGEIREATGCCG